MRVSSDSTQATVAASPASKVTFGRHPSSSIAREISGRRRVGSSTGRGQRSIFEREAVSIMIRSARSSTESSKGFPILIGSGVFPEPHQFAKTVNRISNITERAGLTSVAVDRNRLVPEALDDEMANDAAVVELHAWPISAEDAGDTGIQSTPPATIGKQCLCAPPTIVASSRSGEINMPNIVFLLGWTVGSP